MSDKAWNTVVQGSLMLSGLGVVFMVGCPALEYDTQTKTAIIAILGTLVSSAVAKYFSKS
jgi:hypothetical protein